MNILNNHIVSESPVDFGHINRGDHFIFGFLRPEVEGWEQRNDSITIGDFLMAMKISDNEAVFYDKDLKRMFIKDIGTTEQVYRMTYKCPFLEVLESSARSASVSSQQEVKK